MVEEQKGIYILRNAGDVLLPHATLIGADVVGVDGQVFFGIVSKGLCPFLVTSVVGATGRDVLALVLVRSLVDLEVADGVMLHTMPLPTGPLLVSVSIVPWAGQKLRHQFRFHLLASQQCGLKHFRTRSCESQESG